MVHIPFSFRVHVDDSLRTRRTDLQFEQSRYFENLHSIYIWRVKCAVLYLSTMYTIMYLKCQKAALPVDSEDWRMSVMMTTVTFSLKLCIIKLVCGMSSCSNNIKNSMGCLMTSRPRLIYP